MPVRQHALAWVGRQVRLQPGDLRTTCGYIDLGIQGIDAPGAKVVGIVRRNVIEILEVTGCTIGAVFMITGDWFGPVLMSPPG